MQAPHLQHRGAATELIVRGAPTLLLGGELANSSASDLDYLRSRWPALLELELDTLLVPVYWELLEPEEGRFDFELVDGVIEQAREHGCRLVLLWFGSYKNSQSCYAPLWVKRDAVRFERAVLPDGRSVEILSAFCPANVEADARAFAALLEHLRRVDAEHQTVVMVQVENEIGMLEAAREHGLRANAAFAASIPPELSALLRSRARELAPEAYGAWQRAGSKTEGTWTEVFGGGAATEELFTAWYYARYTEAVAAAGKQAYSLPMFVNGAQGRPGKAPGEYPSGGPLAHLLTIWKTAAPSVDFASPDIYFGDFAAVCAGYHTPTNPLFIPEAWRGDDGALDAFHAFGEHAALGFAPFAVDAIEDPQGTRLKRVYRLLRQLAPVLGPARAEGRVRGVSLTPERPRASLELGGFELRFCHDYTWEWSSPPAVLEAWPRVGALVISLAEGEYFVAGSGVIVNFASLDSARRVGFASIDEGSFDGERWQPRRRLNGDENHQGRHVRLPIGQVGVQRVSLYTWEDP